MAEEPFIEGSLTEREEPTDFLTPRPSSREERSLAPWIVAGGVVAVVIGVLVFMSLRSGRTSATSSTPDPYASQLEISGVALSQSSNGVGSQITYVDGQITNKGNKTVSGVTVHVMFSDSLNQPGQEETLALNLIRTRDPYIDIQPVSAAPIKPGESKDFRLIFDHVSQDWNQQSPMMKIMQVKLL